MLNLVSPVWGMGAEMELECGVQMCEGESKAYQLLVPEGGGLFLVFFLILVVKSSVEQPQLSSHTR